MALKAKKTSTIGTCLARASVAPGSAGAAPAAPMRPEGREADSPWANLKNRPKSWTYLQFVGGSDFFAEMDSARFGLSKSVCWERKLASKVVQKVLRSGRFSPCACSLAAEPQRSFSFLLHACCHSDRAWQAILDACVRAFGPVNCFQ